jgi:hypothetical protein
VRCWENKRSKHSIPRKQRGHAYTYDSLISSGDVVHELNTQFGGHIRDSMLPVDFPPMSYDRHIDQAPMIVDLINNPIVTNPQPP